MCLDRFLSLIKVALLGGRSTGRSCGSLYGQQLAPQQCSLPVSERQLEGTIVLDTLTLGPEPSCNRHLAKYSIQESLVDGCSWS